MIGKESVSRHIQGDLSRLSRFSRTFIGNWEPTPSVRPRANPGLISLISLSSHIPGNWEPTPSGRRGKAWTSMIGNGQGETEIPVDPAKQFPERAKGSEEFRDRVSWTGQSFVNKIRKINFFTASRPRNFRPLYVNSRRAWRSSKRI